MCDTTKLIQLITGYTPILDSTSQTSALKDRDLDHGRHIPDSGLICHHHMFNHTLICHKCHVKHTSNQCRPLEEWIAKGHQRDANLCGA